jgi:NAD(P)-dependent dehydrogenase (short-subunit alcohol dehydrogenase family)
MAFAAEGARCCWPPAAPANWPKLRRAPGRGAAAVHSIDLDVRNRHAVQRAIDDLPPEWAEIDILVNNAGLSRGMEKLYTGKIEDWEEMIDTNIKGLLYVARAVVPGMVVRGRGHVVNLGSMAGEIVYPNGAVYCGTKAAARPSTMDCARTCWARRCASPASIPAWSRPISAWCASTAMLKRRQGLQGHHAADRRRYCRCDSVGRDAARACEHCARVADFSASGQYAAHPPRAVARESKR